MRPKSGARVKFSMDRFKTIVINMSIDLGGPYIGMAEHFL